MRLTRHQLYLCAFFLLPLIYFLSLPIAVGDLAIWIAQGRYWLTTGTLLRHDVFSFAPTRELVYPALTCLLYGLLYQWGLALGAGAAGALAWVALVHKAIVVAISAIWYRSSLARLKSPWSELNAAIILLAWWGSAFVCVERPSLVAVLPFLAAYLILQKETALTRRELAALLLLNVAWVNLHGSFPLLTVMMAWRVGSRALVASRASTLSRRERSRPRTSRLEFLALGALPVTALLNPFGAKVFPYVLETVRFSRERGIDEWSTTDLTVYFPQGALFYVLLVFVGAAATAWLRVNREKFARFACSPYPPLLLGGILSIRNTIWPFLALLPLCAQLGVLREHREARGEAGRRRVFNGVLVAVMGAAALAFLPQLKPWTRELLPAVKRKVFYRFAPLAFGEYLREPGHKRGRIFNNWDYGSYLALGQSNPFFIDTRNVIYEPATFDDYRTVITVSAGWEELLRAYGVRYVLLEKPENEPLIKALRATRRWTTVLEDDETVLFSAGG